MKLEEAVKNREKRLEYLKKQGERAIPENVEAVRLSIKALMAIKEIRPCKICLHNNGRWYQKCWMCANDPEVWHPDFEWKEVTRE